MGSELQGHFELLNCTRVILDEVAMPEIKRNDVALTYSLALRSSDPTDWKAVNAAIIKRWSLSGLEYIKNRAWKLAARTNGEESGE